MWMVSFCRADVAKILMFWGVEQKFNNTRSREVLGMSYDIKLETTLTNMVDSMIDLGLTEDRRPKL